MQHDGPSRTAWSAAHHRAAHQLLEGGQIFADPFAVPLVGGEAAVRERARPGREPMRTFIAVRHRVAEDEIAAAVGRGVRQVVVLGAGLDTFALRNPHADRGLRVWEVDHPATQSWKRDRLRDIGIRTPAGLTFAAVDFEVDDLAERLAATGVDRDSPIVYLWLGVVPYLTAAAIASTLAVVGETPGSSVILDHPEPAGLLPAGMREWHAERAAAVARLGEPWVTAYTPDELRAVLGGHGLTVVDDVGVREIAARWFGVDVPSRPGGHVVVARTRPL